MKYEIKSSMYTTGGEGWLPFAVTVNNNGAFVYHFRRQWTESKAVKAIQNGETENHETI